VGALVFTAWNVTLYRNNLTLYRRTNDITEQGQVTDRFTKAIDQLGSDKDRLDVRIGGIYALERIARDSPRDQPAVIEVLSAYIREQSREEWLVPRSEVDPTLQRATRPDVQAALTVIGRRDATNDRYRVDLQKAELYGADLRDAYLAEAFLFGAKLEQASLNDANLYRANLAIAKLDSADLRDANLSGAYLVGTDFSGADLTGADLSVANLFRASLILTDLTRAHLAYAKLASAHFGQTILTGADLTGAELSDSDLSDSDLSDSDLSDSDLSDSDLTDAKWPAQASVPEGWMRDTSTGRLQRASTESGPDTSLPGQLLSAACPTSSWPGT
jgi:uncharacterized protein YjbI with pentapeptide repeats